jgi:hypothetical protein
LQTKGHNKIAREKVVDFIQKSKTLDRPLENISDSSISELSPRERNLYQQSENKISIVLRSTYTAKRWGLIPFGKKNRSFFPGYQVPFTLVTDIGELITQVTSAPAGTRTGDPMAGSYIQGNLKPWFTKHVELKDGDKLIIEVVEPRKKYRLTIEK